MKKRIVAFLLIFVFTIALLPVATANAAAEWDGITAATAFSEGTGTVVKPWLISTPEELAYLAKQVNGGNSFEGEYIRLTADIDLGEKQWTPIGAKKETPFKGIFDGGAHVVSNLYIYSKSTEDRGLAALFGALDHGTVKNLRTSGSISGVIAAGIVAWSINGKVLNCISSCGVAGSVIRGSCAGGIVCLNEGGTVANCAHYRWLVGAAAYGCIVGQNSENGRIVNCFNAGTEWSYGILAGGSGYGSVENCYTNGPALGGNLLTEFSGCASFAGWEGILTPVEGQSIIGGAKTLIDALNIWVDAQAAGEYLRWVQLPGMFPTFESTLQSYDGKLTGRYNSRSAADFSDIPASAWYFDDLDMLVKAGGVNGMPDGTFAPEESLTAAQFIKLLTALIYDRTRLFEYSEFESDLSDWCLPYLSAAEHLNLLEGVDVSREKLDMPINRYEAAQLLWNFRVLLFGEPEIGAEGNGKAIGDFETIPEQYRKAVLGCYADGLINGKDESGNFFGNDGLKRCEGAAIAVRLFVESRRAK